MLTKFVFLEQICLILTISIKSYTKIPLNVDLDLIQERKLELEVMWLLTGPG